MARKTFKRKPRETRLGRLAKRLARALLVLLLLVTIPLLVGVPAPVVNFALRRLENREIFLEARQLTWRPKQGFVLHHPELYAPMDRVTPWFRAESVEIRPGFRRRLRRDLWSAKIKVNRGEIDTELGMWADDLTTRKRVRVSGIHGRVYVDETLLRFEDSMARLGDFRVRLQGEIPLGERDEDRTPREITPTNLPLIMRTLAQVVEAANEFSFSPLAELHLQLRSTPDPRDPFSLLGRLEFSGSGMHRGFPFTSLELHAAMERGVLMVDSAHMKDELGRELRGEAWIHFRDETVFLHMENSLPRYAVEHLSPVPLSTILERAHIRVEGRSNARVTFGPGHMSTFGNQMDARLDVGDAFYRDAFFPELSMNLVYRDRVLHLTEIEAEVGLGSHRGPATGEVFADFNTGEARLQAESAFNPAAILSLLEEFEADEVAREWQFRGAPPRVSVEIHRDHQHAPVRVGMDVEATEVVSRGVLLGDVSARVDSEGQRVEVTGLRIARLDAIAEGWMVLDFGENLVELDVLSTFPLADVAPFLGPEAVAFLEPYRFLGGSWARVNGRVDIGNQNRHNLEGKMNLNGVVWNWLRFENLSFSFHLEENRLTLPDIQGTVTEGKVSGTLSLVDVLEPGQGRFDLFAEADNIDLHAMITAATDVTDTPYTGILSGKINLEGQVLDPPDTVRFGTWEGTGNMAIREGELFRIPLLLGLSRILSRVVRGFGYASQTDFSADFTVADGRIRSDNLFLQGRVMSIEGDGWLDFDNNLRANMKVQLLSEGFFSEAFKILLWPLRKLIEVRLTGTLEDPQWELRNIP